MMLLVPPQHKAQGLPPLVCQVKVMELFTCLKKRKEQTSSSTSSSLIELQCYLNQPLFDIGEEGSFDLLMWWKNNKKVSSAFYNGP